MEPRPLNKPQRPAPAAPPTIDRSGWASPPPAPNAGYAPPLGSAPPPYSGSSGDPLAARAAWFDPAAQPLPQQGDPGYSPGPALTPINGGRAARFLGPILALVVLAGVIGALVFVFSRFVFDGGAGQNANANIPAGTTTALARVASAESVTNAEATKPGDAAAAGQTAVPTEASVAAGDSPTESPEEPTNTPKPTAAPVSALSMLPTTAELPDGFKRTENDKRTMEAVASSFANPEEATANLEDWDWRENAYRTFEIPAEDNPDPNTTTVINVSIHRFGEKTGAAKALTYFADSVVASQGLQEFEVEQFGDKSIALSGAPDGSNLVVLYIRSGYYLIRIGGSSPLGDPTQDVLDLAKKIVDES